MNKDNNFVLAATFYQQGQVLLFQSALEGNDIPYYTSGENMIGVWGGVQPVQFFLPDDRLEEAAQLIKDLELDINT